MQTFLWDQNYVTGLDTVDQQHRRLVDLINQLGASLAAGGDPDRSSLQALFRQLAAYARHHFGEEERIMLEAGISPAQLELHRASHRGFIEQVSTMWKAGGLMTNAAETVHAFLLAWLGFHILGEDLAMARQVTLIRAGESPATAHAMEVARKDPGTAALLSAVKSLYLVLSEQNRDLARANLRLEEKVAERTRELSEANQALNETNRGLQRMAEIDGLLEIANRKCFDDRLEKEWRRGARERKPLAVLMIDVDHFKPYNDRYGHQAGDHCLKAVAQAAESALRRPGDLLARYGGEELVMLLPNTEHEGAHAVALSVCARLRKLNIPHAASPVAPCVTTSIGVASVIPDKRASASQVVAAADHALYSAKEGGRNRIC